MEKVEKNIEDAREPEKSPKRPNRKYVMVAIVVALVIVAAGSIYWAISPSGLGVLDSDGDGYSDGEDAFPNDPTEWNDTDSDGVGDNSDAFPEDPSETIDSDGDGYGDNEDEFPNNPGEHLDSDGDEVGDNSDAFPYDSTQWADRDGDGHGDNPIGNDPDAFPDDPGEWKDTDIDGIGDNADFYDQGNGKIRITIDFYREDGSADPFYSSPGDPYFVIRVDGNKDGIYESIYTSDTHQDEEVLFDICGFVVDIDDGQDEIRFTIEVYDSDPDPADPIDYTPSSQDYWRIHTVTSPYSDSWSYNGSNDFVDGEIDCELEYSIAVVN